MENKKLSDADNLSNNTLKNVKSNYFFRKFSRDSAHQKLIDVVPSNKNAINQYAIDSNDSLLLKTCKLIGDIEKIEFIAAFKSSSEAWSPLKKILQS